MAKFGWCQPLENRHPLCKKEFTSYGKIIRCSCDCHHWDETPETTTEVAETPAVEETGVSEPEVEESDSLYEEIQIPKKRRIKTG